MLLPIIVLANVQSLRGNIDKLQAKVKYPEDYKHAYVLALTETWVKAYDLPFDLEIEGFGETIRLDRDPRRTGKSLGGGLCLYVNQKWCNTIVSRETI